MFTCLQSCITKNGVWKNEQIPAAIQQTLHELNKQVFGDLKNKRNLHLEYFLAQELVNDPEMQHQVEVFSNELKNTSYKLFDEYYIVHKQGNFDSIANKAHGVNGYNLYSYGTTREMYTAFWVAETGINRQMITAIYCKFDYGWKLYHLSIRPYTFNGKTAFELMELATNKAKKGYIADAVLTAQLAATCLRPSDVIKYQEDARLRQYGRQLISNGTGLYKYPITINQVTTKPQIIGVYNKSTPAGYYPMVGYLSKIKLTDTTALKTESAAIMKVLGSFLPGIDKEKKWLFHRVYNKASTPEKMEDYFDIKTGLK